MAWTIWSLASRPRSRPRWAEEASEVLGAAAYADRVRDGRGASLRRGRAARVDAAEAGRRRSRDVEPLADTEVAGVRVPAGHARCSSCTATPACRASSGPTSSGRSAGWRRASCEASTVAEKIVVRCAFGAAAPRFAVPAATSPSCEAKTALGDDRAATSQIELDPAAAAGHRAARLHDEPVRRGPCASGRSTERRFAFSVAALPVGCADAIREVAGARQRLPDRRGGRRSPGS